LLVLIRFLLNVTGCFRATLLPFILKDSFEQKSINKDIDMIRQAKKADAKQILILSETLAKETHFMLREAGEDALSIGEQEAILTDFSNSNRKVFWIIEIQGEIVGLCVGIGSLARRNQHNLYCVMGILQQHTGRGLGRKLLEALESWAEMANFSRLELTVMKHNKIARALYLSHGFEEEGLKRQSLKLEGEYVDEVYMSKLLSK
jgi:RimJ/RimL family protein N-acetyltransferase